MLGILFYNVGNGNEKGANNMERIIPMQGVLNFRDIGGYQTNGGKEVRRGLFYRSAGLANMTDPDKQMLQTLGIKTIFDYRDDHEAEGQPTPVLAGIQNIRMPAKGSAMFKIPSAKSLDDINGAFFKQIDQSVFQQFYANMPFGSESFQKLFAVVKDEHNLGLLHHCAAGKDRTGVGTALMLMALDVPRETIIEDYLLTNELLTPMVKKFEAMLSAKLEADEMQGFYDIIGAKESYLQAVFSEIDTRYEQLEDFYRVELHVTEPELQILRSKYTV